MPLQLCIRSPFSMFIESLTHFLVFYILRKLVGVSVSSHRERYDFPEMIPRVTWCNAVYPHRCEHTEKFRATMKHSQHPSQHSTVCRVIHGDCSYLVSRARATIKASAMRVGVVQRQFYDTPGRIGCNTERLHRDMTRCIKVSLRVATVTVSPHFQNEKFV